MSPLRIRVQRALGRGSAVKVSGGPFMKKISGPKIVLSLILIHGNFLHISKSLGS